jgi:hypothetical protein
MGSLHKSTEKMDQNGSNFQTKMLKSQQILLERLSKLEQQVSSNFEDLKKPRAPAQAVAADEAQAEGEGEESEYEEEEEEEEQEQEQEALIKLTFKYHHHQCQREG